MWRTLMRWHRVVPTSLVSFLQANAAVAKAPDAALHGSTGLVVADTNSSSIYENLAAEEALIRGLSLGEHQCVLLFYVNAPCVVVGRNQNIFQEVALRRAAADSVDVARRASGGGAVFHDTHNLCFSFLTHRSRYAPEKTIQLLRLGLSAGYGVDPARITTTGRYDLFLDGRKITGSAMRVQRDIAYHHCTLLVNTPHALLGRYLQPQGQYVGFATSSVGSVRSPVTTLTESRCVPESQGVMSDVKTTMIDFFFAHGAQVLDSAQPWDTDIHALRDAFATSRASHHDDPVFLLDVRQAVDDDVAFIEGEGRRAARGDAATVGAAVRHARSPTWAYAMPPFTSTVQLTREAFTQRLRGLSGWPDVVHLSSVAEPELVSAIADTLFSSTGSVVEGEVALRLRTTVEQRIVSSVAVTLAAAVADGDTAAVPETEVEWLSRYLSTLLVGNRCDAAVDGIEAPGDAAVLAQGFLHEAGAAAPSLPDVAREASVLMAVKVVLTTWREKNVFDLHRGST